ncbi:MAG: tryptophan synthase subunit alpha [Acidobacteriota bacterium]
MFKKLRMNGRRAIVPFLTAGYPDIPRFYSILRRVAKVSDCIEIGVPFSDPLADGRTIQDASQVAIREGMTLHRLMDELGDHFSDIQTPVLLMTYLNPIFQYPLDSFLDRCRRLGIAGIIIPDLSFEESSTFRDILADCRQECASDQRSRIETEDTVIPVIQFISPATREERLKRIVSVAEGFLYVVSITGTTGSRNSLPEDTQDYLKRVRQITDKPLCLGFGISGPRQIQEYRELVDGFIVGSAILERINSGEDPADFINHLRSYL